MEKFLTMISFPCVKKACNIKICSTRHERYGQWQWIRQGRKQFRFFWRGRGRSCATTGGIFDFIPFSLHFLNALTSKLADVNYDLLPPAGDISRYNLGQWKEINVYCSKKVKVSWIGVPSVPSNQHRKAWHIHWFWLFCSVNLLGINNVLTILSCLSSCLVTSLHMYKQDSNFKSPISFVILSLLCIVTTWLISDPRMPFRWTRHSFNGRKKIHQEWQSEEAICNSGTCPNSMA